MKAFMKINIVLLLFTLVFASCKKDDDEEIIVEPIAITSEIKALGSYWGNTSSDVTDVLINTQGGPAPVLDNDGLRGLLRAINVSKTKDLLVFNVHQAQTKNPDAFVNPITFEEAKAYSQQSVEDLATVVKYFKNQGKKVHVLGISFGAFMTQGLLAKEGSDVADDYLIMIGRLDIPEVVWKASSEGNEAGFENGVTPFVKVSNDEPIEKNMSRLAAGLGFNRYTELLAATDLSKVTYVYGELDEQVGRLSEDEVNFLTSKGATVVQVPNADHDGAVNETIDEQFGNAFGL